MTGVITKGHLRSMNWRVYPSWTQTPAGLDFHTTSKTKIFPRLPINIEAKHADCRDTQTGKTTPLYRDEIKFQSCLDDLLENYLKDPTSVFAAQ